MTDHMIITDDELELAFDAYDFDQREICPHGDNSWYVVECDRCMLRRVFEATLPAIRLRWEGR